MPSTAGFALAGAKPWFDAVAIETRQCKGLETMSARPTQARCPRLPIGRRAIVAVMAALAFVGLGGDAIARGIPHFEPVTIGGSPMNLPRGWERRNDDASLILTENPSDEASAMLMLIAVQATPGRTPTTKGFADQVLMHLGLEAAGIRAEQIEERANSTALYRLHRLEVSGHMGYLASYTNVDSRNGVVVHMAFSALDARFVELGGPALPLVVFAGLDPATLASMQRSTAPSATDTCTAGEHFQACIDATHFGGRRNDSGSEERLGDSIGQRCQARIAAARSANELSMAQAECNREAVLASQILRMSHETSMKIIHSIGSGWCYTGEPGCN